MLVQFVHGGSDGIQIFVKQSWQRHSEAVEPPDHPCSNGTGQFVGFEGEDLTSGAPLELLVDGVLSALPLVQNLTADKRAQSW